MYAVYNAGRQLYWPSDPLMDSETNAMLTHDPANARSWESRSNAQEKVDEIHARGPAKEWEVVILVGLKCPL